MTDLACACHGEPVGAASVEKVNEVTVEEDLDFRNASEMCDRLTRALERGGAHVVVDLGPCRFVDSSGMQALVVAARRAEAYGVTIRLRNASGTLVQMLRLSGLAEALGIPGLALAPGRRSLLADTGVGRWEVARLVLPARPEACALARHAVLAEAAHAPLTADDRADLELAVGEACANAVRHGSPRGEQDHIMVRSLRGSRAFVVEVVDRGDGFQRGSIQVPRPGEMREGGLGIFYMEALMDAVEFEQGPEGMIVRLVKAYRDALRVEG